MLHLDSDHHYHNLPFFLPTTPSFRQTLFTVFLKYFKLLYFYFEPCYVVFNGLKYPIKVFVI